MEYPERERENVPVGSCAEFYDLALKVTQCHFYHIQFVKSESVRLSHIQGEGTQIPISLEEH